MLNVAIIGAGRIADLHAPGYIAHPDARIAAVVDRDQTLLARRAEQWGAPAVYADYRDMLDAQRVQAVEILTPHASHTQLIIDSLAAGMHVSVQKPMAISLEQCDAIVEAAAQSDRIFRVFENFAYYEPLVRAKQVLDDGTIGEPVSLRIKTLMGNPQYGWHVPDSTRAWRFDAAVSGDGRVVLDYGWHIFAMSRILLGPPAQVFAQIKHTELGNGITVDCPLSMQWTYADNDAFTAWQANSSREMVVKSDYYPEDEWFEITGTRGAVWVNQCTGRMLENQPPLVVYADGEFTEYSTSHIDADWGNSFKRGVAEFVDAVADAESVAAATTPILDAKTAREVYKHARATQISARENRPTTPDEVTE